MKRWSKYVRPSICLILGMAFSDFCDLAVQESSWKYWVLAALVLVAALIFVFGVDSKADSKSDKNDE